MNVFQEAFLLTEVATANGIAATHSGEVFTVIEDTTPSSHIFRYTCCWLI